MHKKQNFITGAAVLAAASVLCKIIAAVFKIPLDRFFLHEEGFAIYQSACSVYNVFLAVCVTGIPIALSSLVAGSDEKEASELVYSAFMTVTAFCAASALFLYFFAKPIAMKLAGGTSAPALQVLKILAPALLAMGPVSSIRGYFQGKAMMLPPAISQVAESIMKTFLGIILCAVFIGGGVERGAAGAMLGVTAGAFSSCIVLLYFYRKEHLPRGRYSFSKAGVILKLSLPVTLGTFGFTAALFVDAVTVNEILAFGGVGAENRLKLFGYLSRANIVYNLPAAIITAITASIVPVISKAQFAGDRKVVSSNTSNAVRLIFFIALPCAFGLMFFAPQVFSLLYSNSSYSQLLVLTGLLVLIMPYFQTVTGVLQALGCVWKPIFVGIGAVLLKTALNFVLIPRIGIYGAQAATAVSFLIAAFLNMLMLEFYTGTKNTYHSILKMLICAAVSCGGAKLIYIFFRSNAAFVFSIIFAAALYLALLWVSGAITKEDAAQLRG